MLYVVIKFGKLLNLVFHNIVLLYLETTFSIVYLQNNDNRFHV